MKTLINLLSKYPNVVGVKERTFESIFREQKTGTKTNILAIESVCDRYYFLLFGAIRIFMGNKIPIKVDLIMTQSINGAIGTGWMAGIKRISPLLWVKFGSWRRAFGPLIDRVGYRSCNLFYSKADLQDWFTSKKLWLDLQSQNGLLSLNVSGIEVADLVIDTYLRFKPYEKFMVNDKFVRKLIWQVLRDIRTASDYFEKIKPNWYLTSHSTYIQHGIATRVALKYGISVWSFGNLNNLAKKLSNQDYYHTQDCSYYKPLFLTLDNQDDRIELARNHLDRRILGGIDEATVYMRQSAYVKTKKPLLSNIKGGVVIFLHDFFDSPHVYHDFIFNDFWDWVCFTINVLSNNNQHFFIKPHPNQIGLNDGSLERLRKRYPKLNWLSSDTSNSQIAEEGIICGVTAYGTVAHELAYLGIPTICCARHPHHSFSFTRTAKSLSEYEKLLQNPSTTSLTKLELKKEALIFYYMHNLYGNEEDRTLISINSNFWRQCNYSDDAEDEIIANLRKLTEEKGFDKFINELIR